MDNDNGDSQLLLFGLVGLGIILHQKVYPGALQVLKHPETQIALIAGGVLFLLTMSFLIFRKWKAFRNKKAKTNALYKKEATSSYCGQEKLSRRNIYVTDSHRTMHTQIVGTTNAGKTESVILPWAIQDIKKGGGLIIIDGKADRGLLDKLWSYTVKYNRQKDFKLLSLSHIDESFQYNPFVGNSPEEVTERVFSAFEFENSYYKNIQFEVFSNIIRLFFDSGTVATFKKVHRALKDKNYLRGLSKPVKDEDLKRWVTDFLDLTPSEREQRVSGLKASLSHFSQGKPAEVFDTTKPSIDIDVALAENQIIYFQLPVLLSPFLGRATGKMVLQNLQSAIANRHRAKNRKPKFYSVFLDDFTEYIYPGFVSLLNKSRSANIGVVFAHQALGDIKSLGDSVANSILTNSNLKIFMRGNDPESAEYFSKVIGTTKTFKFTERRKKTWLNEQNTGDQSAREVDEFVVSPNKFKNDLGTGEAIMIVPYPFGTRTVELKFTMFPDITTNQKIVPLRTKPEVDVLPKTKKKKGSHKPLIEKEEVICI